MAPGVWVGDGVRTEFRRFHGCDSLEYNTADGDFNHVLRRGAAAAFAAALGATVGGDGGGDGQACAADCGSITRRASNSDGGILPVTPMMV